jgi:hypothetical protein
VLGAAGNRALARLAATERGRRALGAGRSVRGPDGRVLQRVGEEKLGYAAAKDAPATSLELLKGAFAEMRTTRKAAKDKFESTELSGLDKIADEKARQKIVMNKYVKALTIKNPVNELTKTSAFTTGKLKLAGTTVQDADGKTVATIIKGAGVFEALSTNPGGGDRKAFKKTVGEPGKTYVADDLNIPTRRYAYVEKSIYQMMEFVRSLGLTGRYQRLHKEMGQAADASDVTKISSNLSGKINLKRRIWNPTRELAVLHQWMGSGLQQRGLSLTSTPRQNAVFGNKGESFKSGDGVRITIDLAKVPKSVKLINHYAAGGITSFVGDWVGWNAEKHKASYNYGASVLKNRELYLERLDPAWVEAIEVHGTALEKPPASAVGAELIKWVGDQIGYWRYVRGYRDTVKPPTDPVSMAKDPAYIVGENAGTAYVAGYAQGEKSNKLGKDKRWDRMETEFLAADVSLQRKEDYWVGWSHGVAGVAKGSHIPDDPPAPVEKPPDPVPATAEVTAPVVAVPVAAVVVTPAVATPVVATPPVVTTTDAKPAEKVT